MPNNKNTKKLFRRLQTQLVNLIYDLKRKNASGKEIEAAISRAIDNYKIADKLKTKFKIMRGGIIRRAKKEAEKRFKWVKEFTATPGESKEALKVIEFAENGFAKVGGVLKKDVLTVVVDGLRKQEEISVIKDRLIHKLKKSASNAGTITNTALAGFDRIGSHLFEEEAGVKKWKYSGPPPERAFCMAHYGKTYTRAQFEQMSNGHGLPVFSYLGGYNCRHWKTPVIE